MIDSFGIITLHVVYMTDSCLYNCVVSRKQIIPVRNE